MMDYGYNNPRCKLEETRQARLRELRRQGATVPKSINTLGYIVTHDPETGKALEVSTGRTLGSIISQPISPEYDTDDVEQMRIICLWDFGQNLYDKPDEEVRKYYTESIKYLRKKRIEHLRTIVLMHERNEENPIAEYMIKAEEAIHGRPLNDQEKNSLRSSDFYKRLQETAASCIHLSDSKLLDIYSELLTLYLELLEDDKRDEILEMINWIEEMEENKDRLTRISEFLKSMEEYSKALKEDEPKSTETESTESKSTERKLGETATRRQ